jgi:hypothetical protein
MLMLFELLSQNAEELAGRTSFKFLTIELLASGELLEE